jgi:PhnB protein
MLYVENLSPAIDFYTKAFNAKVRWQIPYEGKIHVAELEIGSTHLRLHEESATAHELSPSSLKGTTVVIHLLAQNADDLMKSAIAAGATVLSPMKDQEYGFRQGNIRDPFGHHWCLERMDDIRKVPKMP